MRRRPGLGKTAAVCGIEPTMLTGDSTRKPRRRARCSGASAMPPTTTAAAKAAAVTHRQDATERARVPRPRISAAARATMPGSMRLLS